MLPVHSTFYAGPPPGPESRARLMRHRVSAHRLAAVSSGLVEPGAVISVQLLTKDQDELG